MNAQHDRESLRRSTTPARAVAMACLFGAALALGACNTVKGLGKDIQTVGEKSEEAITGDEEDGS